MSKLLKPALPYKKLYKLETVSLDIYVSYKDIEYIISKVSELATGKVFVEVKLSSRRDSIYIPFITKEQADMFAASLADKVNKL